MARNLPLSTAGTLRPPEAEEATFARRTRRRRGQKQEGGRGKGAPEEDLHATFFRLVRPDASFRRSHPALGVRSYHSYLCHCIRPFPSRHHPPFCKLAWRLRAFSPHYVPLWSVPPKRYVPCRTISCLSASSASVYPLEISRSRSVWPPSARALPPFIPFRTSRPYARRRYCPPAARFP